MSNYTTLINVEDMINYQKNHTEEVGHHIIININKKPFTTKILFT